MPRVARFGPPLLLLVAVLAGMLLGPDIARQVVSSYRDANIQQVRADLQANPALTQLSDSFTKVAQIVEPSVVHIDIAGGSDDDDDAVSANGSGWVYDAQGHIITNYHVVHMAEQIRVRFIDGTVYEANVVGGDAKTDIAVLKIKPGSWLRSAVRKTLGSPENALQPAARAAGSVEQGQIVFAFGSPFTYAFSMSQGIVSSAEPRRLGITGRGGYERFIQTDAAINPGNSGGPLTNLYGEVVGMNTAIASDPRRPGGGFMGLGFAIPVNLIEDVAEQIIERGEVVRGYLGVYIETLTPALAESFGMDASARGVLVQDTIPDGPAREAGLQAGDVIVQIDDHAVSAVDDLRFVVGQHPPGSTLRVKVWRDGA